MPRIVAGSKAAPWTPPYEAARPHDRAHEKARRKAEANARRRAAAMPIGAAVEAVWRLLDGPPVRRRGVLVACVPWPPIPSVLVAVVRWPDGTTSRLDATRLVRARGVH
jgi:hypothetical protein